MGNIIQEIIEILEKNNIQFTLNADDRSFGFFISRKQALILNENNQPEQPKEALNG
jgi:hypothetical protein